MKKTLRTFVIGAFMSAAIAASSAAETAQQQFVKISDEYFDTGVFPVSAYGGHLCRLSPVRHAARDYSKKTMDAEAAALRNFEQRIAAISASGLDQPTRGDREIVLNNIRSQLLTLETIRPWEKNPDTYSSGAASSIFTLMERKFASPDERLRSAIARERLVPSRLKEARENLKNPPRIYTEIAIEQLPGIVSFFEKDVPDAFADAKDPALKAELQRRMRR